MPTIYFYDDGTIDREDLYRLDEDSLQMPGWVFFGREPQPEFSGFIKRLATEIVVAMPTASREYIRNIVTKQGGWRLIPVDRAKLHAPLTGRGWDGLFGGVQPPYAPNVYAYKNFIGATSSHPSNRNFTLYFRTGHMASRNDPAIRDGVGLHGHITRTHKKLISIGRTLVSDNQAYFAQNEIINGIEKYVEYDYLLGMHHVSRNRFYSKAELDAGMLVLEQNVPLEMTVLKALADNPYLKLDVEF